MKRYPALRPECILSWDYLQKVDAILKEGKRTAFVCTADEYALEIMKVRSGQKERRRWITALPDLTISIRWHM